MFFLSSTLNVLTKKIESHIGVGLFFFGFFFLGFFSWGGISSGTTGGGTTSWGGTDSGSNVGDQTSNIDSSQSGGEETWPEWFDGDAGGFDDFVQVIGVDFDIGVVKDEGGVGAAEFRVGHFKGVRLKQICKFDLRL